MVYFKSEIYNPRYRWACGMKIAIFGASEITLIVADIIFNNNYSIEVIVTLDETFNISYKKEGVKNYRYFDMKQWAKDNDVPVIHYQNSDLLKIELEDYDLDYAIIAGWYHMVPSSLRQIFKKGCYGFHSSLLPNLRGGAPLNWAILSGMSETGVSMFELSDGVDDGDLIAQRSFSIDSDDYILDLIEKSKLAIIDMLQEQLPQMSRGDIKKFKQAGVPTYSGQRMPSDSVINWHRPVTELLSLIKASSHPYAGAYCFLNDVKITIWRAKLSGFALYAVPGQIFLIDENIHIACGDGALQIVDADNLDLLFKSNQKRLETANGI